MDGPLEHSDSDSGESWTLLEPTTTLAEDTLELIDRPIKIEKEKLEVHDKDEDTDGISIISDSDPDSVAPCQMHFETLYEEDQEPKTHCPLNLSFPEHDDEHIRNNDFLGMDTGKHKTYVHRRNKRLSTVLNIIVLGSVITAAGVAIGHMWGAKTDCLMNSTPNVNNILSSLYKLQEENAYLRSKLKELTANQNFQLKGSKNNRCAKVFEESLSYEKNYKPTRCVDNTDFSIRVQNSNNKWSEPGSEREFKGNIDKLKNIYLENKHWLDDEIALRLQQEEQSLKRLRHSRQATKYKKNNEEKEPQIKTENNDNFAKGPNERNESAVRFDTPKIISYADSLNVSNNSGKKESQFKVNTNTSSYSRNKKIKKEKIIESGYENPVSEEELVKDTRYNGPKYKRERKKHDRQKTYKKQKRRNKYEQWEMKEGFMKDYDELSEASQDKVTDSQDPERVETFDKKCGSNHCDKNSETKFDNKKTQKHMENREGHVKNSRSYRAEMRRLEEELFGEEANSAGWYFRRMQRREQCRAKGTNNTNQKFSKRNMNYKMKH
ncbi:nucleolar protein 58-like [Danaus plexippus]|uniref:nucleolar protein 58-like n=1 Tax=Danaus plexippus TaxID=13037 RepID=UPI002AB0D13A|nr:nucleolar protein 58-like [Danaus plexippus]